MGEPVELAGRDLRARRLTVARCNALLGVDDADRPLADLVGRWVLESDDHDRTYPQTPVVRQHLVTELRRRLGDTAMWAWLERSADVVGSEKSLHEALIIRCHAADWNGVRRLVRGHGRRLSGTHSARWVHLLPPESVQEEPWAALAFAVGSAALPSSRCRNRRIVINTIG